MTSRCWVVVLLSTTTRFYKKGGNGCCEHTYFKSEEHGVT